MREDELTHQVQLLQTQLAQAVRQPMLPNAIQAGRIAKPMRGMSRAIIHLERTLADSIPSSQAEVGLPTYKMNLLLLVRLQILSSDLQMT